MNKPRLLDVFSGAGGCTKGYQEAGFEVIGVDLHLQPNYCGSDFIQADALEFLGELLRGEEPNGYRPEDFAAIHASPPCQNSSSLKALHRDIDHPELIPPTRELLLKTGLPYVIENVVGAALIEPTMLCGSGFSLKVRRHRLFETSFPLMSAGCAHGAQGKEFDVYEHGRWRKSATVPVYGNGGMKADEHWESAMGIDWMTRKELAQAIPPAYTRFVGEQLFQLLQRRTMNSTAQIMARTMRTVSRLTS